MNQLGASIEHSHDMFLYSTENITKDNTGASIEHTHDMFLYNTENITKDNTNSMWIVGKNFPATRSTDSLERR